MVISVSISIRATCQTDFGERVDETLAGNLFDEAAERYVGHIDYGSHFGKRNLTVEILVHIGENRFETRRMGFHFLLDERGVGQQAAFVAERQAVQDHQHIQHGLHTAGRPLFIQFPDMRSEPLCGLPGKKHTPASLLEKLLKSGHRIAVQEFIIYQIGAELQCDFVNLFRFAAVGEPCVGRIAAHQHQFHVADGSHMIADHARSSGGVHHQIELHLLMGVERKVETTLLSGKDHETIIVGERGALAQDLHTIVF